MSHYKPYPVYKDSGVEWIGKVPEHWEVRPVYSLATVRNGYPFASELFKHEGVESDRLIRIRDIAGDDEPIFTEETCPASAVISNGDVLIGMDGDFNVHRWMRGPAKLNQRMCAVSGRTEEITQFLSRCLPIPMRIINELAYATTVKHLSSYEVLHTRIAVPPTHELSLINTVLDRETARIDALIAKKTEFIELLEKKRQALITHAVTKGLDPNVKMKDSGVEWIGEVPAHWKVRPIKSLANKTGALFIDGDWIESKNLSDSGIRYITTGNVGVGEYKEQGSGYISESTFEELSCTEVFPGDVLVSRLNPPIGRACIVPNLGSRIVTSVDNVIFRPALDFSSAFVVYRFSAADYFHELWLLASGATMQRVSRTELGNVRIAWPPLDEQLAIVAVLDRETTRIDTLIAKTKQSIGLLKKRRSALITAAVTGQIDLREST